MRLVGRRILCSVEKFVCLEKTGRLSGIFPKRIRSRPGLRLLLLSNFCKPQLASLLVFEKMDQSDKCRGGDYCVVFLMVVVGRGTCCAVA